MAKDIISVRDLFDMFKRLKRFLLQKWYVVLLSICLFACFGIIVSLIDKPKFKAKLTFVLQESETQSSLGSLAGLASQFGIASAGGSSAFNGDNIIEILKSKNIIYKALLTENDINGKKDYLINHYLFFNGCYDDWKENVNLKNLKYSSSDTSNLSRTKDSILNIIYKNITANILDVDKLKPGLDIILIKTLSINETFSKLFTENLIKSVTGFYISSKTQRARETFQFLQNRADSTKKALDAAVLELAKWQDSRSQLVKYEGQVDRSKLMRNVEILQLVYSEILKNLEISKMNLLNITPLVKVIDSPILPLDIAMIPMRNAVVIGAFFGFILSVIILFIAMILSDALHKDDEIERL